MDEKLLRLMEQIETFGKQNDSVHSEKNLRMRNVTRETGEFLCFLVSLTQAKTILEIGTSNGYSTLWLAEAAQRNGGRVTTVEFMEAKIKLAWDNFAKSGLCHVIDLKLIDAGLFTKQAQSDTYDFIFLDSNRVEYVEWWQDIKRLSVKGGLIVVDNVTSHHAELQGFIAVVKSDPEVNSFLLTIGAGLLLIQTK